MVWSKAKMKAYQREYARRRGELAWVLSSKEYYEEMDAGDLELSKE